MNLWIAEEELKNILETRADPCVTIYMPAHRRADEVRQDTIRLRNLLSRVKSSLGGRGMRAPEAKELLRPAEGLLKDPPFWLNQIDGLALFRSPETFRVFRLPLRFPELAVVGERFHLKPLLPLFTEDGWFYILALSQNRVRLLQGTRDTVVEVEPKGIPASLEEALQYDDPQKQLQFHTQTAPSTASGERRSAMFHGHGVGIDENKDNIRRFFQQIDDGFRKLRTAKKSPLVLAGVEFLLPIYREVNRYPHLVDGGIPGNPEELNKKDLHRKAWEILRPRFQRERDEAVARYRERLGTGLASHSLEEILPAAYDGRVEVLFTPVGVHLWGSFDPQTRSARLDPEAKPGTEDLLDLAAVHTFLKRGTVYALKPKEMPDRPAAAIFRY